jgi:hypothetical protein
MGSSRARHDIGPTPRLLTREQAAAYCNVSPQCFSSWVKIGRLPGPLTGTARWDLKAINAALDLLSGIVTRTDSQSGSSALDQWKAQHALSS